jgi:hypothetical protein
MLRNALQTAAQFMSHKEALEQNPSKPRPSKKKNPPRNVKLHRKSNTQQAQLDRETRALYIP